MFAAFNFKFDSAVIEIPDTAGETSLGCDTSRKRSIPDPLNFSLYRQPRSEHCRFNLFSHAFSQTAQYEDACSMNGYSHTSAEASRVLRFRARTRCLSI